jgi:hypothetical protein
MAAVVGTIEGDSFITQTREEARSFAERVKRAKVLG